MYTSAQNSIHLYIIWIIVIILNHCELLKSRLPYHSQVEILSGKLEGL